MEKLSTNNEVKSPVWLSVSEAAKIGGVQTKTIRRAIQDNQIKYKIIGNRYLIDFSPCLTICTLKPNLKIS